ncbi:MAG: hypothetical protein ACXADB_06095 [Candidatus Hermodarchaeia archaeon]|jgi:hypothetical protein
MNEPKFEHNCTGCKFLGHYLGYDVYICSPNDPQSKASGLGTSILARFGNDGPDYASSPLSIFQRMVENNENVKDSTVDPPVTMPFQEWVFQTDKCVYHAAWMLALTVQKMKEITEEEKT